MTHLEVLFDAHLCGEYLATQFVWVSSYNFKNKINLKRFIMKLQEEKKHTQNTIGLG